MLAPTLALASCCSSCSRASPVSDSDLCVCAQVAASDYSFGALYDVTFAYSDPLFCPELGKEIPPSVMDYLDGAHGKDVPKRLHVHVRRVSTSGEREGHPLFSDPETYLQQSFEEKEALLQHFSEHGAYPVRSFLPCRRLGFCCLRTASGISIVVCILAADPWSGLGRGEGKRRRCPSHAPTSGWSRATASCCSASGCSGRSRSGRSLSISVGAT